MAAPRDQSTLADPWARWSPRGLGVGSVSSRRRRLLLASNRTINPDLHDLLLAARHHPGTLGPPPTNPACPVARGGPKDPRGREASCHDQPLIGTGQQARNPNLTPAYRTRFSPRRRGDRMTPRVHRGDCSARQQGDRLHSLSIDILSLKASACPEIEEGTSSPSAVAVFRLIVRRGRPARRGAATRSITSR
jgi:hypothetical protein